MPVYEYHCNGCNSGFSVEMSVSEYEQNKNKQTCPGCGSTDVSRKISVVEVQTSKKS